MIDIRMNDWPLRRFYVAMSTALLVFVGVVGLRAMGVYIPIVQELPGIFLLTLAPGFMLLRIMRFHDADVVRSVLYAVGLSLLWTMLSGLVLNTLGRVLLHTSLISLPAAPLWTAVTLLALLFLTCLRDADPRDQMRRPGIRVTPSILALALLPLMAVFGALYLNWTGSNILQLLFLLATSVAGMAVVLKRKEVSGLYPWAVYMIALALLLHVSLVSNYLNGWDIQHEYYLANQVLEAGCWSGISNYLVNPMLSITMLVPMYSLCTGLGPVWVFKIIFPLLFALMPVGLYWLFNRLVEERAAVMACLLLIYMFVFYGELQAVARQEIAELFLVLVLMQIFERHGNKALRWTFLMAFGAGLVLSHYGLTLVLVGAAMIAWAVIMLERLNPLPQLQKRLSRIPALSRLSALLPAGMAHGTVDLRRTKVIHPLFIAFVAALFLFWDVVVCSGTITTTVYGVASRIVTGVLNEMFDLGSSQAIGAIITPSLSLASSLLKLLYLLIIAIIGFEILRLVYSRGANRFDREYSSLAVSFFLIAAAGLVLPYLASSFNTSRLFHIALIILAPLVILGGQGGLRRLFGLLGAVRKERGETCILSVFLAIFLLLNAGFLNEVMGEGFTSLALDPEGDFLTWKDSEVVGGRWLLYADHRDPNYADQSAWILLNGMEWGASRSLSNTIEITYWSHTFLRSYNIESGQLLVQKRVQATDVYDYKRTSDLTRDMIKIYDDRGSEVYYTFTTLK